MSAFEPTVRVDIFDHFAEMLGGTPVKIGEVLSDGRHGELRILEPRFGERLEDLFLRPKPVFTRSGRTAEGDMVDGGLVEMQPFRLETLRYLIEYDLRAHNLRGEIVQL